VNARFELALTTIPNGLEVLDDRLCEDDDSRAELVAALIDDYVADAKALGAEIIYRGRHWSAGLKRSTKADEVIARLCKSDDKDAPKSA
jgi:hypothetical protein